LVLCYGTYDRLSHFVSSLLLLLLLLSLLLLLFKKIEKLLEQFIFQLLIDRLKYIRFREILSLCEYLVISEYQKTYDSNEFTIHE